MAHSVHSVIRFLAAAIEVLAALDKEFAPLNDIKGEVMLSSKQYRAMYSIAGKVDRHAKKLEREAVSRQVGDLLQAHGHTAILKQGGGLLRAAADGATERASTGPQIAKSKVQSAVRSLRNAFKASFDLLSKAWPPGDTLANPDIPLLSVVAQGNVPIDTLGDVSKLTGRWQRLVDTVQSRSEGESAVKLAGIREGSLFLDLFGPGSVFITLMGLYALVLTHRIQKQKLRNLQLQERNLYKELTGEDLPEREEVASRLREKLRERVRAFLSSDEAVPSPEDITRFCDEADYLEEFDQLGGRLELNAPTEFADLHEQARLIAKLQAEMLAVEDNGRRLALPAPDGSTADE